MKIPWILRCLAACALLIGGLAAAQAAQAPAVTPVPIVAAASDLRFVLADLLDAFVAGGGARLRVVYGSSGDLYRQILEGAPYALFLSADDAYPKRLAAAQVVADPGVDYAVGHLCLLRAPGSALAPDGTLGDLKAALAEGRISRFAIADPTHAPYGRAAQAVLAGAGIWEKIAPFLVKGENVAQAARFAASGSAAGGLISLSFAHGMGESGRDCTPIAATAHPPIRQRMVLLRGAGPVVVAFYRFLIQPPAQRIFLKHGYTLPEAVP